MIRTTVVASVAAACALVALASPAMASDPSGANVTITVSNPGPASPGQSQAGGTYRLTARVPVACWVRPETTVTAGEGSAGAVVEACNNPGGFTVTASYRPLKTTERAEMVYGDRSLELAKSGQQLLRRSSMATIKRTDYRFGAVELDEPLVLSLTIQPI